MNKNCITFESRQRGLFSPTYKGYFSFSPSLIQRNPVSTLIAEMQFLVVVNR
jgi:hypothetical protein